MGCQRLERDMIHVHGVVENAGGSCKDTPFLELQSIVGELERAACILAVGNSSAPAVASQQVRDRRVAHRGRLLERVQPPGILLSTSALFAARKRTTHAWRARLGGLSSHFESQPQVAEWLTPFLSPNMYIPWAAWGSLRKDFLDVDMNLACQGCPPTRIMITVALRQELSRVNSGGWHAHTLPTRDGTALPARGPFVGPFRRVPNRRRSKRVISQTSVLA